MANETYYEQLALECLDDASQVSALQGVGYALLNLKDNTTVVEMREHAAEHDCVLMLRLIDLDTFGVTCSKHNEFHLEWRTT